MPKVSKPITMAKMPTTRLNKYIASSGLCSRRKADELIESGVVMVNGKIITELGFSVKEKDKVFVNNKLIDPIEHIC
jgi:23S rRNA pseudouridine2605 synthase